MTISTSYAMINRSSLRFSTCQITTRTTSKNHTASSHHTIKALDPTDTVESPFEFAMLGVGYDETSPKS